MTTQTTEPTQDTTVSTIKESDNSQSNTQKATQLVETIKIEGEPFQILKWDDKYYLTLGKYRLTEAMDTEEEARAEVTNVSWFRLLQIMHIVVKEELNETRYKNNANGGSNNIM